MIRFFAVAGNKGRRAICQPVAAICATETIFAVDTEKFPSRENRTPFRSRNRGIQGVNGKIFDNCNCAISVFSIALLKVVVNMV